MKVKLLMPFFLFMLSAYSQAKVMCAPKAKNITIYRNNNLVFINTLLIIT